MELIVTEKDNAARRIAEILSDGTADAERVNGVNVYGWGGTRVIGLSGHVVGVDFPPEYDDWRDVEPHELIEAPIDTEPTQEAIVAALRRLSRDADRVIIATDYDREGELIGKEAFDIVRDVDESVPIERARFSSITENEVQDAFANTGELDFDLAAAGEARQTVDLVWGAALTRFLSLSAGQLGEDFISVGRVQGPTLKLLVDREREIQAFDPDDYWELFADLTKDGGAGFEAQYFYLDEDGNEARRIWDEVAAENAHEALASAADAAVEEVNRRTRTDEPPAPFNTTQFIRAASSLGYSAQRAMSIAEDLYTAGYITYPRTDNTVYPDDLDPEELLEAFSETFFGDSVAELLEQDEIEPTEGDEETTDHPPIHPTGEMPTDLDDDEWEVYELVVRRFFATCAPAATWEHLRVVAGVEGEVSLPAGGERGLSLKANGKRLLEEGYHSVYPYSSADETVVPDVERGEALAVSDVRLDAKETQPPRRYGQSRLIETMEEMGVGTKCLTEDTEVLVRSGNDIERRKISAVFEDEQVVLADGDTEIATTSGAPKTISVEEATDRAIEAEGTLVSKRELGPDEEVVRLRTANSSFSVTSDHPLYVRNEGTQIVQAGEVEPGDELLSIRPTTDQTESDNLDPVLTWETFATESDRWTKLYGTDSNNALAETRAKTGQTQRELADQLDIDRAEISAWENSYRDVPVWVLGRTGIRPDELHGLNEGVTFENPFPIRWSPNLARVLANLLGDGSIHVDESENVVDVRYHNTDKQLIERFASDIEAIFGVHPSVSDRPGRESHHQMKYQANVPSSVSRILHHLLETVEDSGCPAVPDEYVPSFIGALMDDEGHVSRERKAFISNTNHELLAEVGEMLEDRGIETKLAESQHKLHIRGRENLERFFDQIPVAIDEKYHRALDALRSYDVTRHKARILELTVEQPRSTSELAAELGLSEGRVGSIVSALRRENYLEKQISGSNRSHDGNRTIRYVASAFEGSIYGAVLGKTSGQTVLEVTEREYDGPVYDLTVDEDAPNFAVGGGVVVHNSTRHNTIEKLYDRNYVEGDPPRPTQLAHAVVEAAEEFADHIVSEEMTAQLEADMRAIAAGEKEFDEVTAESREMLETVFEELRESREEVGDHLRKSMKADKILGPCPECGEDLLVRKSRYGSYFVGCDGYPDCEYTLPLPSTGKPLILDEKCEEHGLNRVKMLAGRKTFVHGCPLCKAEEADAEADRIIGACPECGEEHGGELAIKQLRSGSRLVGCTRYPDCDYSLPLPRRGEIEVTEETCEEHHLPHLVVHGDDDEPWELGCPICNYREFQAREADSELETVEGIGEKTAEKLAEAGVEDVEGLKDADPDELASSVDGVSAGSVRDWQAKAD
ncbi:DNA topoisomerase I [Halolamina sediminis]|uniref:DNA topoisomerase I n=1 Tax=Halolamina sediminis TaxID=1480675 RepID=UPI0006B49BA3|nr:DNA topoisomerase I [Halolamina sediminis]